MELPSILFRTNERAVLVEQSAEDLGSGYAPSVSGVGDQPPESDVPLTTAIQEALATVADTFTRAAAGRPDELHVEFAIRLHYRDGAVISTDVAGSHFKVTCVWTRGD
jgi:hypothetical protein